MVHQLYNHPALAIWCMHNEPLYVVDTKDESWHTLLRTYASVLTYWSVVMGWGLVAISLTAPPYIGYFLPKNTQGAMPVVTLLAAGTVLYGGYLIVNIGVTISLRTRMTPLIATAAGDCQIWIDMETRVRSAGDRIFDLDKVYRCLKVANGFVTGIPNSAPNGGQDFGPNEI